MRGTASLSRYLSLTSFNKKSSKFIHLKTHILKQKLLLTFIGAALLITTHAYAQLFSGAAPGKDSTLPKVEFGLKAGLNLQKIVSDSTWQSNAKPGITGGFFLQMGKNKVWVRAEVLAATAHYTFKSLVDSVGAKGEFRANYLSIPLLFEYKVIPWLMIQAGVEYSGLITVHNIAGYQGDAKLLFKNGGFSGILGIEAKLPAKIVLGARYVYGITNVNNNTLFDANAESWKTQAIQIYAGYRIK